jgi:hypothetical protein
MSRNLDSFDLAGEFSHAESGRGTSYLSAKRAVEFMDYCAALSTHLTWLEAFEIEGGNLAMNAEFSVIDYFGHISDEELDLLVRHRVRAAIETGREFRFIFWV